MKTVSFILIIIGFLAKNATGISSVSSDTTVRLPGKISGLVSLQTGGRITETASSHGESLWFSEGKVKLNLNRFCFPIEFSRNTRPYDLLEPGFRAGTSPSYKWITAHLGYRTASLSPMISDYLPYKGIGLDLAPSVFRLSGFYGTLVSAVRGDTTESGFTYPRFRRAGFGVKAGIGTVGKSLDLSILHMADDPATIDAGAFPAEKPETSDYLSADFSFHLLKYFDVSGSLAASNYTHGFGTWATQVAMTAGFSTWSAGLQYRFVKPGFHSPGYMIPCDDDQYYSASCSFIPGSGNITIQADFSHDGQGISGTQPFRQRINSGNLNLYINHPGKFSLGVNISGTGYDQLSGTVKIPDSLCFHQRQLFILITPEISLAKLSPGHALEAQFQMDLTGEKGFSKHDRSRSLNFLSSATYTMGNPEKKLKVAVTLLYQRMDHSSGLTQAAGIGCKTTTRLMKNGRLSLVIYADYRLILNRLAPPGSRLNTGTRITFKAKRTEISLSCQYTNQHLPSGRTAAAMPGIARLLMSGGEIQVTRRF